MSIKTIVEGLVRNAGQQPDVSERGLPLCSEDECRQYDGKRCRATGFRPGSFCEPALLILVGRVAHVPDGNESP